MYTVAIFTPCLFNFSSDESEAESGTENDDAGNIIKLLFVDESNIPNMGIGEPNIVTGTGKSTSIPENNMDDINNTHTSKRQYYENVNKKQVLLHQLLD